MSDEDFETVRATVQLAHQRYALADGTERHVLEALARLESQNQALQERAEKLEGALRRITNSREHYMDHFDEIPCELCQLLSPTQETDPE